VKKYSTSFVQLNGNSSEPFYFFNRYDRETVAQSWQVFARVDGNDGGDEPFLVEQSCRRLDDRNEADSRAAGPKVGQHGTGQDRLPIPSLTVEGQSG
jgi:hypothetical protein